MATLTIVIGGNGAGKTTWCRQHRDELPEHFYNADSIAEGLGDWNSGTAQEAARKIVDERIRRHLTNHEDFGFESTYSGESRPHVIIEAKRLGYGTRAILIATESPTINIERVTRASLPEPATTCRPTRSTAGGEHHRKMWSGPRLVD